MSIWDNIKDRFGKRQTVDRDNYDDDEFYDDDYYYDDAEFNEDEDEYHDQRLDGYQSTANSPLVSLADIRSQPVNSRGAGSREDRIPMPIVRERRSAVRVTGLSEDDSEAYRDSLARSSENSLVQLHSERIQVESRPVAEFTVPETLRQRQSTNRVHAAPSVPLQQNTTSRYSVGATRFTAASSESRTTRQVEHLRPLSYGDAEGISIGLRNGSAVVLDLTSVRPELAKRILDFSFGVTSAFEGQVDRYADRVYILTRNGTLTESERLQIKL